ncbi:hypothetical protein, partial [Endozoicomonas sp. YOMI1]|uniref:hypothetical protein n=1 Tax=Endozoicomonas sp. YOMI1 TaxID=2828739 RepID=UPI002148D59E
RQNTLYWLLTLAIACAAAADKKYIFGIPKHAILVFQPTRNPVVPVHAAKPGHRCWKPTTSNE